jgi:hypothetical protein
MTVTKKGMTAEVRNGVAILSEPVQCRCGRMAYIVRVDGGTRCIECAEKEHAHG